MRRHRTSLGQESHAFPQTGPGRLRYPVPSNATWAASRFLPTSRNLGGIQYATGLTRDEGTVDTIEHLLAALVSRGIDNVIIELNTPEVPIMDGSAAPFIYLLQEAGIKRLSAGRRFLKVLRPIAMSQGDKRIAIYPSDHFKVTYSISFDHPLLRHQARTLRVTEEIVRRRDRAGAHVLLPQGSRDAAAERPGARRLARQRDRASARPAS